ncbi:MAG: InlB B-repeat-containing protein [Dehalococcoidia bacterium]|nr:InlB B-repeat-containing protein [Dehalococcoidia bacterium]
MNMTTMLSGIKRILQAKIGKVGGVALPVILAVCLLGNILGTPPAVMAAPGVVTQSVEQHFTGDTAAAPNAGFTYKLTPRTPFHPLPSNISGGYIDSGSYIFTLAGTVNQPLILDFSVAATGTYTYDLTHITSHGLPGYSYDDAVYTIEVRAGSEHDITTVVIRNQAGDKVDGISYNHSYIAPPTTATPQPPAYRVYVNDSYASPTGAGTYAQGEVVTIHAGARDGYTFTGWTVVSGGVTLFTPNSGITTFTMPANDVTVRANWIQTTSPPPPPAYTVYVNDSYASTTGAGTYTPGSVVTINAGARDGYTFAGWTVVSGGVTLANSSSATTTFTMPANDVTVRANWTQTTSPPPPPAYTVYVNDSYASTTGAGTYTPGNVVTIHAGARDGYTFIGWTVVSGGVTLANSSSATTTFTMPANDVTVRANWTQTTGGDPPPPPSDGDPWALVNLILCLLGVLLAVLVLIRAFLWNGVKDKEGHQEVRTVKYLWLFVVGILAVIGVIVFFLTEDMSMPVRLVDIWTIVNATIFILEILVVVLIFDKKKKELELR